MIQELLDLATGKVYRRTLPGGEWETPRRVGETVPIADGGTGATSVSGAVAALGLTSVKGNAPYVRSINPSTLKVKTGSSVLTFKGSYGTLFTPSQMTSLLGRAFNQATDAVLVMNGDNSASLGFLVSAASHSDGLTQVYAKYWGINDKDAVGPFRVNWVVVYS